MGVDGIELDVCLCSLIRFQVWLTRDGVPVVLHGGVDGQVEEYTQENKCIFEYNFIEIQSFDVGEGERVPTLDQVFELVKRQIFINIEIKTPYTEIIRKKYDYKSSLNKVYSMIRHYGMQRTCCISSFDRELIKDALDLNKEFNEIIPIYHLYNYHDYLEIPDDFMYYGHGINISSTKLNKRTVELCKQYGMRLGVWIDADVTVEDSKLYNKILKLGVDVLITDYPLIAMEVRNNWYKNDTRKKQILDS